MYTLNKYGSIKNRFEINNRLASWAFFFYSFFLFVLFSVCFAESAPDGPIRILCLGDSITQSANIESSYRYYLWKDLIDHNLVVDFIGSMKSCYPGRDTPGDEISYRGRRFDRDHEGHTGWTADQILGTETYIPEGTGSGNLNQWLNAYTPDIVLLHLGHNDAGLGEPPGETAEELKTIILLLQQDNPRVSILLAKVIPSSRSEWNARLSALNSVIQGVADDTKTGSSTVMVIDFSKDFNPETDTFDGIHTNAKGAEKMAKKWLEGILTLYQLPSSSSIR